MTATRPASVPCAWCQLPVPGSATTESGVRSNVFCCYGCRLASEITQGTGEEAVVRWMLVRVGTSIFLTLNLMAFSMALWTSDVYAPGMANQKMEQAYSDLFRYLSLLVSGPVMLMLGPPLARSAWEGLKSGRPGTDLLVVIGVWAAFLASVYAVFSGNGPIYFEVSCIVLIFVTLGRWLEASGKLHTQKAMDDLTKLMPDEALVIRSSQILQLPVDQIQVGDILQLRPGDRVACDSVLIDGEVTVDEQILTGESLPILKKMGDKLMGGTLLFEGNAHAEVLATMNQSTIARLVNLVRQARDAKGRYARLADRVAQWLLPVVLVISIAAGVWHDLHGGLAHGLLVSMSVLLIACPCAVGLATPLAVWSAMGAAARRGVLFADAEVLEKLAEVDVVFFDKTGTLTTGQPELTSFYSTSSDGFEESNSALFELAARSGHPLAKCLFEWLKVNKKRPNQPGSPIDWSIDKTIKTTPGRGIAAYLKSDLEKPVALLGSYALMSANSVVLSPEIKSKLEQFKASGQSILIFSCSLDDQVQILISFDETLRADARPAIQALKTESKISEMAILTGDHAQAGRRIAEALNVGVIAELLPDEKQAVVSERQSRGKKVVFVGEGYNDAPAMALADVGIALGAGADLTRDNASVCIVGNQMLAVPYVIDLASVTVRRIRRNLFWAFFYNAVGLVLAFLGLLSPTIAAAIMFVSSIAVVSGSWTTLETGEKLQESFTEENLWQTQPT